MLRHNYSLKTSNALSSSRVRLAAAAYGSALNPIAIDEPNGTMLVPQTPPSSQTPEMEVEQKETPVFFDLTTPPASPIKSRRSLSSLTATPPPLPPSPPTSPAHSLPTLAVRPRARRLSALALHRPVLPTAAAPPTLAFRPVLPPAAASPTLVFRPLPTQPAASPPPMAIQPQPQPVAPPVDMLSNRRHHLLMTQAAQQAARDEAAASVFRRGAHLKQITGARGLKYLDAKAKKTLDWLNQHDVFFGAPNLYPTTLRDKDSKIRKVAFAMIETAFWNPETIFSSNAAVWQTMDNEERLGAYKKVLTLVYKSGLTICKARGLK